MFIYFARPIDQAKENSWLDDLAAAIEHKLSLAGIGAFRPHTAYLCNPAYSEHAEYVDEMNDRALFAADAVLAILPSGVPTLGVPAEIEMALALNKPVVVFSDILASIQLAAWKRRGATVLDLTDPDFKMPESDDLRQLLRNRPDESIDDEAGSEHPQLPVKYQLGASPLTKAHPHDAGFDLATIDKPCFLHSGERTLLKTGVHISVPDGWYARITGRSSALARHNIQVHEGIIDAGYTGELMIGATYQGLGHKEIAGGSRLAQVILAPTYGGELLVLDELPATLRGDKGWGSSGV